MTNLITDLASRKGKPCHICGEKHIPQNRCRFEAMASKIARLTEANGLIPQILNHNKEATDLATHFRSLLKKADEAHAILMGVLEQHGEIGAKIRNEYLGELDKWASESTNQDTTEQLELSSQENLTQQEMQTENSMSQKSGEDSPENS